MSKNKGDRLDWKQYSWSDFEQICFEYIKTIYSRHFYKTTWTNKRKDGGKDIIVKALKGDFIAWGECKSHHRSVDLSVIGKNVVLALSRKINKAIFFSVSGITLNTKIEILNVAQSHGFDVMFLDGVQLDVAILSCATVARKYFRTAYENQLSKEQGDIVVRTVLSEYEYAEDSFDYEKEQYYLANGFDVYLHVFIKNLSNTDISELKVALLPKDNPDLVFYGNNETTFSLNGFTDYLWSLKGLVFSSSNNIQLPVVRVLNPATNDVREISSGIVDASDIWLIPLVGKKVSEFLQGEVPFLQDMVEDGHTRCIFVYGKSGMGKSRLLQEIGNKCNSYGFRTLVFDFRSKSEYEVFRELLLKLLCIPLSKFKVTLSFKEFHSIVDKYSLEDVLERDLYDFLFRGKKFQNRQTLVDMLFAFTVNPIGNTSVFLAFDNVQEVSGENQMVLWDYTQRLESVQTKALVAFTENTEMRRDTQNYLLRYLHNEGFSGTGNFISRYKCTVLAFNEATSLLQSMLMLSEDSALIAQRIVSIIGCRPLDVLLTAKTLTMEKGILIKEGKHHKFHDMKRCNDFLRILPNSLERIIEYRYKNFLSSASDPKAVEQVISLLVLFNGKVSAILIQKVGLNDKVLFALQDDMILKRQIPDGSWLFYHDSLFSFCTKHTVTLDEVLLKKIIEIYEKNEGEHVSPHVYLKSLIGLSRGQQAIDYATKLIKEYKSKHEQHLIYYTAASILPLISDEEHPDKYFDILFQYALSALQSVDNAEAERLFESLNEHVLINGMALGFERLVRFYHYYANSKLHALQYDKALNILQDFSKILRGQAWNHRIRLENRLCVAYFHLARRREALNHINVAIRLAQSNNDMFWLSTSYSDKAYTYFYTGHEQADREKAIRFFNEAIDCYRLCNDISSYRKLEILIQKSLSCTLQGSYDMGKEAIDEAISEARKSKFFYWLIPALNFKAYLLVCNGEFGAAKHILQESLSYANVFSINKSSIAIYLSLGVISILESGFCAEAGLEYFLSSLRVLREICKPANSFRFHVCIANLLRAYVEIGANEKVEELLAEYIDGRLREHYEKCLAMRLKPSNYERLEFGMLNYMGWGFSF